MKKIRWEGLLDNGHVTVVWKTIPVSAARNPRVALLSWLQNGSICSADDARRRNRLTDKEMDGQEADKRMRLEK
jgi:hypothetical protein